MEDLVEYFEGVRWLNASKEAMMAIIVKFKVGEGEGGKVDFKGALGEIV